MQGLAGCHTDSPSHGKYQQASLTHVPKAPCSPPQPANSTVTFAWLPSSRCSAPTITLYPQAWNRGSGSPSITNNQGCETDSHANTPGCSHPLPPTPLTPLAPHPAHSTAEAHAVPGARWAAHTISAHSPALQEPPTPAQPPRLLVVSPY